MQMQLHYFSKEELLRTVRNAGLRETHIEVVDYNLSAAPPIFYLDTSRLREGHIEKAQKEYAVAVDMIREDGKTSPPALIIRAAKHPK
jgi:hypothetical protein